jgi:hypothetical protein
MVHGVCETCNPQPSNQQLKGESSKEKMFTVVRSPFTAKRSSKLKGKDVGVGFIPTREGINPPEADKALPYTSFFETNRQWRTAQKNA